MTPTGLDLATLDRIVPDILGEAGEIALRYFRTAIVAEDKGGERGFDPVTEADRGIEDLIRSRLTERFPDHQVTGEERGTTGLEGRYRWTIDPIDGTKSFVSGSPLWGILVGLLDGDVPVAGWVHQPYLDETFAAVGGEATFTHAGATRPMRSRQSSTLDTSVMYTTFPESFRPGRELDILGRLSASVRLVRYGGDCYSYCMIALGHVDLVIETGLAPYDIVPIIPIVTAAGGVVTGLDGQPAASGGLVVAAANATLHDQVVAAIAEFR